MNRLLAVALPIVGGVALLALLDPPQSKGTVDAAPVTAAAPAAATGDECESVRDLAGSMQRRRAAGLTEKQALAELSERGQFELSYVVDGVFRADPGTPEAITRHDIGEACKRVQKSGAVY